MNNNKKLLSVCKSVIDNYEACDNLTLNEVLAKEVVNGITIKEAFDVLNCLKFYYFGTLTTQSIDGDIVDVTPYDLVGELKSLDFNITSNSLWYQVTCIERWGYEYKENSNAEYFDNLLTQIVNGDAKQVFDELNNNGNSGFEPHTINDIALGQANNKGEYIVYNDGVNIMTASRNGITIFHII